MIVSHKEVEDCLKVTMLVYNYGEGFKLNPSEDIEAFTNRIKQDGGEKSLENLNETRKSVLLSLSEESPHGKVIKFVDDPSSDLQAVVSTSEAKKRIYIIFRGSESRSDWYYDLSIMKRELFDGVYVHSGFYNQLTSNNSNEILTNTVKDILKEHPDYSVYVCGHSLGGALSTLYGFLLAHEIENDISVISFASPRVGNGVWRKKFDEKSNLHHYRITNNNDIVTASPMINFQHVGETIRLQDDKYDFFPNYSYSWWDFSLWKCWSVGDHDCDLYYERLMKNTW